MSDTSNRAVPEFAVVGHPNKGKSSIVATLSHNDTVAISHRSGTTRNADKYTVATERGNYNLIDTPGFQRPRKVLSWLSQHCKDASQRTNTIRQFITNADCQNNFPDEVALLTPIINGAAILYVVDGSRPYGPEYEAEMQILQWTGQPSMALINPIESEAHVEEWKSALTQFFKSVKVFNPMTAEFTKQTELLSVFAHLNENWFQQLNSIIEALKQKREMQQNSAIQILITLVENLCNHKESQKVLTEQQAKSIEPLLKEKFEHKVKRSEREAIEALLSTYEHKQTTFEIDDLDLPPDLFDQDQWYMWGLNKKQLIAAAGLAGAVSGAALDAAVAGHSFMLGAIGGGILGATSAFFSADKITDLKIKGLPLGGFLATYGPIRHPNFPYVVIGRFLYCFQQISQLSHANRKALAFNSTDFQSVITQLEKKQQKELHQACRDLSKQRSNDKLESVLKDLFGRVV